MIDNVYKGTVRKNLLTDLVYIHLAGRFQRVEDYPFKGSLPYIDIQTLETGNPLRYAEGKDYVLKEKDLVIVKDGHRSGKVFRAKEGIAASTLTILTPRSPEAPMDYLYCYLAYCYEDFQSRVRGTTISHLDMNYLRQMIIPLPEVDIQREIAEKYQSIENLVKEMKEKSASLLHLSDKLECRDLKDRCKSLSLQGDMTLKSWLHQVFGGEVV